MKPEDFTFTEPCNYSFQPGEIKYSFKTAIMGCRGECSGKAAAYLCKYCDQVHIGFETADHVLTGVISLDTAQAETLARQLLAPKILADIG
jgi:hypothetical protein